MGVGGGEGAEISMPLKFSYPRLGETNERCEKEWKRSGLASGLALCGGWGEAV